MKRILTAIIALFAAVNCVYAESCSTANATQSKYTASGCSYTTETRKCCSTTGQWSDWTTGTPDCPTCSSSQCWNGSRCESKAVTSMNCTTFNYNSLSGTTTRTATCNPGSGWSYGSWSGKCICKKGFAEKYSSQYFGSKCFAAVWRARSYTVTSCSSNIKNWADVEGKPCDEEGLGINEQRTKCVRRPSGSVQYVTFFCEAS